MSPERPPAPVALHTVSPGTGLAHSSTQGFWERTEGGSLGGAGDSTALAGGEVWKGEKWPLATWAPLGCSCPKSSVAGALVTQHPLSSLACPPGAGERAGGLARGVGSKPGGPPASSAGPSSPGGPREALGHLSHPCSSDPREICSFLSGGKCRPHYAVSCEPVTVVSRLQGGAGCLFSEAKFNCFCKILGSLCAWLLLTVLFREETAALWCPRWTRRVSTGPTRPSAPQLPAQLLALAFGNPCAGSGLGAPAGGALPSELLGGKAGATLPDSHRSGAAQPSSLQTQAPACHLWRDLVRIGVGVRLGLGRLKGWLGCPVGSQRGGQEPGSLGGAGGRVVMGGELRLSWRMALQPVTSSLGSCGVADAAPAPGDSGLSREGICWYLPAPGCAFRDGHSAAALTPGRASASLRPAVCWLRPWLGWGCGGGKWSSRDSGPRKHFPLGLWSWTHAEHPPLPPSPLPQVQVPAPAPAPHPGCQARPGGQMAAGRRRAAGGLCAPASPPDPCGPRL